MQGFEERGHELSLQHLRRVRRRRRVVVIGRLYSGGAGLARRGVLAPGEFHLVWVAGAHRGGRRVRVGLDSLLKGPHLLNFKHLPAPLLVDGPSLVPLDLELLGQAFFLLFQKFDLLLKVLDLFIRLLALLSLESIDGLEQTIWVFDFVLNERPQLFEERTEVLRFFLCFL